jgi:outer membrane receptor protein involved in Fe transport
MFVGLPVAHAQDQQEPAAESGGLEEVVVSAQKRTENLQDVPLSVQALGTARIEELHLQNFADYASFLPTLSYQNGGQGGGPGFQRAFMRGIASGAVPNHSGSAPSVGTYLDEQPVTTIAGALDIHLYDIARVEALAGPQGTLYGASSQSGTIRIITNKPDPSGFEARYDLEANSLAHGGQGYTGEGFVNIPLSDKAALRVVGWYEKDPGFIDNVAGSRFYPSSGVTRTNTGLTEKNYNDGKTYGGRAALRFDINDNWTVTPSVIAQKSNSNGSYGYSTDTPFKLQRFNPETIHDKWWQAAATIEGKIGNFDVTYAGGYVKRDDTVLSDYIDYSYYYDTAYSPPVGLYVSDDSGTLIDPTQHITGIDGYRMQSHELRVQTPVDLPVHAVVGLYYGRNQHNISQNYLIDGLATELEVTGKPDSWWLTQQVRVDIDKAVFGEVTYDINEKLSVMGGVRFFKAQENLDGFYGFGLLNPWGSTGEKNPLCAANPEDFHGAPCKILDKTVKDSGNSPKLNVTYHITDDVMTYATYSKGFRPGGVNRVGILPPYKPDYLKNYEIGWKSTFGGRRFRFNGAIFQEDWNDFQFSFLGPNSVTQIANAGKSRIRGIETDLTLAASENLTVSAGAAFLDSKLTQPYCGILDADEHDANPCPRTPLAPDNRSLPISPKFKGNLIARYTFNMAGWETHLQGAVAYVGSRWPELRTTQRDILGKIPSYTLTNFSFGGEKGPYSLELFINNAFDEKGQADRWAQCDATVCGVNGTYISPIQPRNIGIKFGQKF